MIELKNITKSFQMGDTLVPVLKGINLKIERGDFVAIMGPSGSGKSTLMNILGMLDIPSTGSYLLNETEVATLTEDELAIIRRGEIGFIFQQFNLLPRLEAWQNVALPLIYSEGKFDFEKARGLLEQVNLGDRLYHKTNEVSGGQMQRIAIARAVYCNSPIIIFDEATSALDAETEVQLLKNLKTLKDKTCILISHKMAAKEICNKEIVIKNKKIISYDI